ncbi:hypothetical protein HDU98_003953 [Podochytrium sp. JEL0797]|nr:hypothetical protein HDU98_003953 [Podochytrium sp. JEL0797]
MGFAFIKSDELTAKWHRKLSKSLNDAHVIGHDVQEMSSSTAEPQGDGKALDDSSPALDAVTSKKSLYKAAQAFFWIPLVTVLREGLEGMVFLGGLTISESPDAIPLAVIAGLLCGIAIGFAIFRAGNSMKLHTFFVSATIFIFYISAGMMSKSVAAFELNTWNIQINIADAADAGFYNIFTNVWHMDCCNPENASSPGWQFFAAIAGWSNLASIGTIVSYIVYWLIVSAILIGMKLMDRRRVAQGREKIGFKKLVKSYISK